MTDEVLSLWGSNVKTLRTVRGMNQEEFAQRLKVSAASVSRWESGTNAPKDSHKVAIAELLDVDVRSLFPLTRGMAS